MIDMTNTLRDLRLVHAMQLALRGLRRAPSVVLIAAITLGISFTAVAILLGVLYGSTRTLPVPRGADVLGVSISTVQGTAVHPGAAGVAALSAVPDVEAVASIRMVGGTLVRGNAAAVRASGAQMSASAFPLLGVDPVAGRWPRDDVADARTIVLSADLYDPPSGDRPALGAEVRIDEEPYTVIGVMPAGFGFPERQSYWTVLPADAASESIVLRVREGANREAVAARISAVMSNTQNETLRAVLKPWTRSRGEGGEAAAFAGLAVLVAVLVAICATNVSILLMVRATERASTLAVHAALGASRAHIAAVLFTEALVTSLAGGVIGAIGGTLALAAIEARLSPHWGYYWMRMSAPPSLFMALLGVVLVTAIAAGTVPALRATRIDLKSVITDSHTGSLRSRWRGRWMVWTQVTLSTVGLLAALLLGAGARRIGNSVSTLPLDRIATASISPGARYADRAARALLLDRVRAQLLSLPNVTAATVTAGLPGMGGTLVPIHIAGDTATVKAMWLGGDEGTIRTYDMSVLRGRGLQAADHGVAVVSKSFADAAAHARDDVLGERIRIPAVHGEDAWAEVVGVVADWEPATSRARAGVIVPVSESTTPMLRISMATSDPATLLPQLHTAVARVDATLAVEQASTLRDLADYLVRMPRVLAGFGVLGGVTGVIVAAIGLYAVMSFLVRSRMHEFGVRLAIGASARHIARDVVREALMRVLPAIVLGVTLAWAGLQTLGSMAGGSTRSPTLYAATALGMCAVAIAATLKPAVFASRLDPLKVLRR
jgi:putative ABC transport system permease protein